MVVRGSSDFGRPLGKAQKSSIDPEVWPRIAEVPVTVKSQWGARKAEAAFAQACDKAGLQLQGARADLLVDEETMFVRIATSGWLGLAESYMAGEWRSTNLVDVLTRLLEVGYSPKAKATHVGGAYTGLDLPPDLVRLSTQDGLSSFGPVFSGVPTTERTEMKSYVRGAGHGHEPGTHYVDVTTLTDPSLVERADLAAGQLKTVTMLLDAAHVRGGTHLLDFPSSGPSVAIVAGQREATIDTLSPDLDHVQDTRQILNLAGHDDRAHVELIDSPLLAPRDWMHHYDAITSIEKLETMGPRARCMYVKSLDRMLTMGGYLSMQTVVTTGAMRSSAESGLDVAKAYLWPAQEFLDIEGLHRLFDSETGLRIIGQTHVGNHYVKGVRIQRENFEGRSREAAAEGYDAVYRRMWVFYLSMKEALLRVGALDVVQLKITTRNRRGRR